MLESEQNYVLELQVIIFISILSSLKLILYEYTRLGSSVSNYVARTYVAWINVTITVGIF